MSATPTNANIPTVLIDLLLKRDVDDRISAEREIPSLARNRLRVACWHGYNARLGFGATRMENHNAANGKATFEKSRLVTVEKKTLTLLVNMAHQPHPM